MTKVLEYGRTILCSIWQPALLVLALVVNNASPSQAISLSDALPHRKVIVIDPGHGGHDIGAVGPSGLAEKVVTLSVAHRIKEILLGAYEVHLTRNDDYKIDIDDRTAIANNYRADIFLSIHAGGGFRHQARGVAIFYHDSRTGPALKPTQQAGAWETGEKPIPWDYIQGVHAANNQVLAKLAHKNLLGKLGLADRGVHKAPCFVLRGADMPAVLIEIGHLSHPADEKEIRNPNMISAAAEAICETIREYFAKYP